MHFLWICSANPNLVGLLAIVFFGLLLGLMLDPPTHVSVLDEEVHPPTLGFGHVVASKSDSLLSDSLELLLSLLDEE